MSVTQHGAHLVKVTRFGAVNGFLVREDDGLTLVDTLVKGSETAVLDAAGRQGAPIVRIVLTHAHADHIGSFDALAHALPDAERLISTRDARFLTGDKSLDPGEPQDKLRGGYQPTVAQPTRTVEPGERIGSLEVVAAPGHTPGQIALLDTRDRTLIAGDAWSTLGGVTPASRTNLRFPLVAMATWHRPTARRTAQELRALDPSRLAVGHGRVLEAPGAAMDAALRRG